MAIKSAESAKWWLENDRNLTPEQIKYLQRVMEEGEKAKGIMAEVLRDREKARKEGRMVEHALPTDS
jgi:predicted component of type VI protein secretion system